MCVCHSAVAEREGMMEGDMLSRICRHAEQSMIVIHTYNLAYFPIKIRSCIDVTSERQKVVSLADGAQHSKISLISLEHYRHSTWIVVGWWFEAVPVEYPILIIWPAKFVVKVF